MRSMINKNLKGNIIIPLFLLAGIIYAIMMTITIPKVMSFSDGMKILDMMPTGYNVAYVETLLKTLGEEGRYVYLYNQIPLDMIYPLLFGVSCCLILALVIKKLGKSEGSLFYLCFLPLFAALFDYCENIGIIALLIEYPGHSEIMAKITNVFSILKSSITTLFILVLIVLLIITGMKKLFTSRENING